jgi:hypothetical protein
MAFSMSSRIHASMSSKQCPFISGGHYRVVQAVDDLHPGEILVFQRFANNIHDMVLVYFFVVEASGQEKRWNVRIEEWEEVLEGWGDYFELQP